MNKKIFFVGFYLVSFLLVFSFSGCLSLDNSSSGYVGTSNLSYSVEQGQVNREKEFSGNGRVLIRPSGTEPKVRVMIEGENLEYITKKAEDLAELIENKLK